MEQEITILKHQIKKYDIVFQEMKELVGSIKQSLKYDNSLKDLKKHLWKLNSLWERIERNQTNYVKGTGVGIEQDERYMRSQDAYISMKIDLEAELQKIEKNESAKNSFHDNLNSLNSTTGNPASSWKTTRLEDDLFESRAREANLKLEIDNQHKIRAELEVKYQEQVTDLQKQINFHLNKIQDAELLKVQHELNHLKHNSENEKEIEACQKQNSMSRELEECQLSTDEVSIEVQLITDKIFSMSEEIESYKEKSILYDSSKLQHEKDLNELDLAKSEIQDLKNQIADWKEVSKEKELLMEEQRKMGEEAKVVAVALHDKLKETTDALAVGRKTVQLLLFYCLLLLCRLVLVLGV